MSTTEEKNNIEIKQESERPRPASNGTEKLLKILYRLFYVAIILIVAVLLISIFPIKGNVQIKIVQSGSMEPDIKTGSVVIIKPLSTDSTSSLQAGSGQASYKVGDVVTFGKDTKKDIPTTHRIIKSRVENGVMIFTTKGDAN
ncbi:MAG: signal peptidase I, partial [Patescibacteria group bacterium]